VRSTTWSPDVRTLAGVTRWTDTGGGVGGTGRRLVKELSAFGVVGLSCFALDIALFQLLYTRAGVGAVTAKLLSTLVATTAAYVGHRYWSFSHRMRTGVRREYSIFVLVNGLTLAQGLAIVALVRYPLGQDSALVLQLANIGSIGLGTAVRYLSYRRWVFPARAVGHEGPDVPARPEPEGSEPETQPA
jgi:putative flippase GtrA